MALNGALELRGDFGALEAALRRDPKLEMGSRESKKVQHADVGVPLKSPSGDIGPYKSHIRLYWKDEG